MFLSLFLYIGVSIVVVSVINNLATVLPAFMDLPLRGFTAILTIIWMAMGLLYFLDTLTLGYFKRLRYNRLYFVIYRITSWCSGSFLYRALYYHLITNFPRRFIQGFLVFFILILMSLPFVKLDYFRFFPDTPKETLLSSTFYDELRLADRWILYASIPSMQVAGDFLPLFIRYNPDANTEIAAGCDYTPSKAGGGDFGNRI